MQLLHFELMGLPRFCHLMVFQHLMLVLELAQLELLPKQVQQELQLAQE